MADIIWNENVPSNDSQAGDGASNMRQTWRALDDWLDQSLEWPGTAHGLLREGATSAYVVTESTLSTTHDSDGTPHNKPAFTSDTSRFLRLRDGVAPRAFLVGSHKMLEHLDSEDPGPNAVWVNVSGTTHIASPGGFWDSVITYSSNGLGAASALYSVPPLVFLTSSETNRLAYTTSRAASNFSGAGGLTVGGNSNFTLTFLSVGTVSLASL